MTTPPERKSATPTDAPCKFLATTIFTTPSVKSEILATRYPEVLDVELLVAADGVLGDG